MACSLVILRLLLQNVTCTFGQWFKVLLSSNSTSFSACAHRRSLESSTIYEALWVVISRLNIFRSHNMQITDFLLHFLHFWLYSDVSRTSQNRRITKQRLFQKPLPIRANGPYINVQYKGPDFTEDLIYHLNHFHNQYHLFRWPTMQYTPSSLQVFFRSSDNQHQWVTFTLSQVWTRDERLCFKSLIQWAN